MQLAVWDGLIISVSEYRQDEHQALNKKTDKDEKGSEN